MTKQVKFTTKFVEAAKARNGQRVDYWGTDMRRLGLRVSPNDGKVWFVMYRRASDGKKRRYSLGTFPLMRLAQARHAALQTLAAVADEDVYVGTAGERLPWRYVTEEAGLVVSRYWMDVCGNCALKDQCTTGKERRISRWEHEHLAEAMQRRLNEHPDAMRQRRETVEHPFGTIKMWMGATHFLMKRLINVKTEMALSVLAYNLTRVMNIIGIKPLMAAIRA